MATLLILQLLLPLCLLAGLAFAPLRARLGFAIQVVAMALFLLALHLAGLWLMAPWWTPWAYWALFVLALIRAWRVPRHATLPWTLSSWAGVVLLGCLGAYAAWTAAQAFHGRQAPAGQAVELQFPLAEGRYYVANGGTNTAVSSHAATLARATPRQRAYFGQSHAVDIVGIDALGFQATGFNPSDPAHYHIFGKRVVAPCGGRVVAAVDGKADMQVPVMDSANMAGNHVLLRCGRADILLAHLRRGTVRVGEGDLVSAGQFLGQVGNSGNSNVPHLHIHAQLPGPASAPLSGVPLPMRIAGKYLVRGDRL